MIPQCAEYVNETNHNIRPKSARDFSRFLTPENKIKSFGDMLRPIHPVVVSGMLLVPEVKSRILYVLMKIAVLPEHEVAVSAGDEDARLFAFILSVR